ncbi:MAG: hypothetical protein ACNA8P_09335 [Phycisphaerales bacterium]
MLRMMDQSSPPHGCGKKLKHSASIRIALWLYPEAKPATLAVRTCTAVFAMIIVVILVWFIDMAVWALGAGYPDMILLSLIMPATIIILLLGDWVGAWSRRTSKVWGPFYREGKDEKFAKIVLRRIARLFGITPLLAGGLAVGVFGRLRCRDLRLEHIEQLIPIWQHRSISAEHEWQLFDSELSRLDDWVATRGPLRVYIRTNLGREFCTRPSGYRMMRQAADQISVLS